MRFWRLWSGGLALTLVVFISCAIGLAQVDIFWPGTQPGTYTGNAIDFGAVPVGTTKTATYTFTITATSATAGTVTFIGFQGGYYMKPPFALSDLPSLPATIAPGRSITFHVTFTPTAAGTYSNEFTITVSGGRPVQTKRQTVTLTGRGVAQQVGQQIDSSGQTYPQYDFTSLQTEIDQLYVSLSALHNYVVGELAVTVYGIDEAVSGIQEDCCPPVRKLEDYCPGPFPADGGQRFLVFLALTRELVGQAAEDLPAIRMEDPEQQDLLEAAGTSLLSVTPEIDQLEGLVYQLDPQYASCLSSYVPEEMIVYLDTMNGVTKNENIHPKLRALLEADGISTAKTVVEKIGLWVDLIPYAGSFLKRLTDDIGKLMGSAAQTLGIAGLLFQYELEKKLDAIIDGLFGIEIPLTATEQQLQDLLRGIPSTSLTEEFSKAAETSRQNQEALQTLEEKICCLALGIGDWLGRAIYGSDKESRTYREAFMKGIIPQMCKGEDLGKCGFSTEEAQFKLPAIKPELENLEKDMSRVKETLERILKELEGLRREPDTYPQDGEPPSCCALTKKIYVYSEGSLAAADSSDSREIVVTTRAFDVSGWIDLTELRDGDEATVVVEVSVAHSPFHTWSTTVFSGAQARGLKYFDEFCDGLQQIVGTDVRITITQTASGDAFATQIPIYYQFIVESQN